MTVLTNYCFDPSWIGTGGTLVNDGGTVARSTEQAHHPGGGSLKAIKVGVGGAIDAYDSDLSRWPTVPASTQFAFAAWVYPATLPRQYQAIVNIYKASDQSFTSDVQGDPYALIPAGQWSLVTVLGVSTAGWESILMPYVLTTGSDTENGETFYTSDWRLSTGTDLGWNFPARGPYLDGFYNAFHSLVQFGTASGDELYTFYRGNPATVHIGAGDYGAVRAMRSTDQGHTWEPDPPETIKSEANMDLRTSTAGGLTPSGRLIAPYTRYNPDTAVFQSMNYVYSDNQGTAWSAQQTISHGSETTFMVHGPMVTIGNGRLLQGWYGDHGGTASSYVVTSNDDGVTWGSATTVLSAGTAVSWFTEASYAYLGDNTIVGLVRDDIGTTYTQVKSTNNGTTWTNQGTTSFDSWATPAPPTLTYSGGMVACHYSNRDALHYYSVYADPDELLTTPDAWGTPYEIGELLGGNDHGYHGVIHPFDDQRGFAVAYSGPRTEFMYSPTDEMVTGPEDAEYFDGRGFFDNDVWSTDSGHENVRWTGTPDGSPSEYYVEGSGISAPAELSFVHSAGKGQ